MISIVIAILVDGRSEGQGEKVKTDSRLRRRKTTLRLFFGPDD